MQSKKESRLTIVHILEYSSLESHPGMNGTIATHIFLCLFHRNKYGRICVTDNLTYYKMCMDVMCPFQFLHNQGVVACNTKQKIMTRRSKKLKGVFDQLKLTPSSTNFKAYATRIASH